MNRLVNLSRQFCSQVQAPTIQQVRQGWDTNYQLYDSFAYCPQTFYYSLTNMMKLQEAENILEVACGSGTLLPLMLQHKRPQTYYLATDLSSNMVELAKQNLKKYFQKFESRLTFDEWVNKQNLQFGVADAEQPIKTNKKFDRIICNLGLMLTPDPKKFLKNIHEHAKQGCLFGLSIWGNMEKTTLQTTLTKAVKQSGFKSKPVRSNFHLYQKVPSLADETGWEVVVHWEQNAPFPLIDIDNVDQVGLFKMQTNRLPEEQRETVKNNIKSIVKETLQSKKVLNFDSQVLILRKK